MNPSDIAALTPAQWASFDIRKDYLTPEKIQTLAKVAFASNKSQLMLKLWDHKDGFNILMSMVWDELGGALQTSHASKHHLAGNDRNTFLDGVAISIIGTKLRRSLAGEAPTNLFGNTIHPELLAEAGQDLDHDAPAHAYAHLGQNFDASTSSPGAAMASVGFKGAFDIYRSPEIDWIDQEDEDEEMQARSDLVEQVRSLLSRHQYVFLRERIVERLDAGEIAERHNTNLRAVRESLRRAGQKLFDAIDNRTLEPDTRKMISLFNRDKRLAEKLFIFLQTNKSRADGLADFADCAREPVKASKKDATAAALDG